MTEAQRGMPQSMCCLRDLGDQGPWVKLGRELGRQLDLSVISRTGLGSHDFSAHPGCDRKVLGRTLS